MRGGSGILTHNNFAGRANPARIFAGQARGGLARFATPSEIVWQVQISESKSMHESSKSRFKCLCVVSQ